MADFPFYKQFDAMDCGPTCLRMIAKFYGKHISLDKLRTLSNYSKDGVSLLGISDAAESLGFKTLGTKISFAQLINEATLPCIVHWDQNHFVVVTPNSKTKKVEVADPANSLLQYTVNDFLKKWGVEQNGETLGIALLLEPTQKFNNIESEKETKLGFGILFGYLFQHKKLLFQLLLGLIVGSLLQLIFPFLTQSIVDVGINTNNLQYIYLVLSAQLMLIFGRTVVDFIRSRILLFISTRINLSILSDFWIKLMRLPLSFFDSKQTGDILQRIGDHKRIESFLTNSTITILFSFINLIVFSIVLLNYNFTIFAIFSIGSILYVFWIRLFLKYRRRLDMKRFSFASKENSTTMQLIQGMQEIKLNNCEHYKRWDWESIQSSLFKLTFKGLSLSQYQQAGAVFINESKNIMITFFVAQSVLKGELTLGAMLAIQYIIGQLNSPIEQLINFIQQFQDAKISLERLNEIHQLNDEDPENKSFVNILPSNKSIILKDLSFAYAGAGNEPILKSLNLTIPEGKITAIVGTSGSGKTTILKLLLKFYSHYGGDIKINDSNLKNIGTKFWRANCGSVMQDGFIFSDTIAKNISVSDEVVDYPKLFHACKIANLKEFIDKMPLNFETKIGADGNGVSAGQKQRILIARAVYKNPEYLFFDEATNALDANNEKIIMQNLEEFFKRKTVIVIAHRLSTVKNADNIIVLENGEIVEQGKHADLTNLRGKYYELVKNQLELGN